MDGHNKNKLTEFEELLKRLETRKTSDLDEFEREAAEGFASLSSAEEARALKSQLDERAYKQLFSKTENKKRPALYWLAAAGLFLTVGLSILYLSNSDNITGKLNVAQSLDKEKAEPPAKAAQLMESRETVSSAEQPITAEGKADKSERPQPATAVKAEHAAHESLSAAKAKNSGSGDDKKIVKNAEGYLAADAETDADDRQPSEPKPAGSLKQEFASGTSVSRSDYPSVREESEQTKKQRAKKANAEEKRAPAAAAPADELSNTPKKDAKEVSAEAENNTMLHYKNGKEALLEELRSKLDVKDRDKPFSALIMVNELKKVTRVKFLSAGHSNKEKKRISAVLKELKGFSFFVQPLEKKEFEYRLDYKP